MLSPKLKITYILSKPPPIWKGLIGYIDEVLLFDWISQNYPVSPPAIPPRVSNYNTVGDSGSNANDMSNIQNYVKNSINDFEEFIEIDDPYNNR